jgi:hypothetical protein
VDFEDTLYVVAAHLKYKYSMEEPEENHENSVRINGIEAEI